MKFNSLILLCLLSSKMTFSQEIEWRENYKLEWKDFKGPTKNWEVAATTCCGILLKPDKRNIWDGKATYKAIAVFTCDSSFYFPDRINNEVLKHEQTHFDIAEIFARKLRKILREKSFLTHEKARGIYDNLYEGYFDFQTKFEEETKLGSKKKEQVKWEQLVKEKLSELDEYK